MTTDEVLFQMLPLAQKGYCCSQILLLLALEAEGRRNPELVRAMAGLCNGLGYSGELCGVLTGGACLIAFYAGKGADGERENNRLNLMISELTEWFREHIGSAYGGITCGEILKDTPDQKPDRMRCAGILAETYAQIMTILAENEIETGR
ncbi:MAG: C-GCAxxG-C-C family protein [Desulfobacterales bacterium]